MYKIFFCQVHYFEAECTCISFLASKYEFKSLRFLTREPSFLDLISLNFETILKITSSSISILKLLQSI